MNDDDRDSLCELFEQYFGTAWGEHEWELFRAVVEWVESDRRLLALDKAADALAWAAAHSKRARNEP